MPTTSTALEADRAHWLHPIHHPSAHQHPRLWVEGRGAVIKDADGREYLDGLAGLWNVHVGHGRARAGRRRAHADGDPRLRVVVRRIEQPAGDRAGRPAEPAGVSVDHLVLFHQRRRRSHRHVDQDGALLLEGARAAGQDEDHLAHARLPRADAGGDERHRAPRVLADVRAARAGLQPHRRARSLPLRQSPIRPSASASPPPTSSRRRSSAKAPRPSRRSSPSRCRAPAA